MLIRWDGIVDEIDGAVRARSPRNSEFIFGNFLLFADPPKSGETPTWVRRFEDAFADDSRINHVCLRWDRVDGARGAVDELAAAGFMIEETVVMQTATPQPPPRTNHDVQLRTLESEADWAAATALQVATMTEQFGHRGHAFARNQMARYRRFVAEGRGAWFGAFADDELVADMGVFVEDGLGRFQAVETAAAVRRRGVCGTLAYHAARTALAELGARVLVIVGLPDHTSQIYRSVGFEVRERLIAAVRRGTPAT